LAQRLTDRGREPRALDEIYALFPLLATLRERGGMGLSGGEQ
jgi:ABC-type branched-subunit amino acid transport system ATPase component